MFKNLSTCCRICLCSKPRKDISEINHIDNGQKQSSKDIVLFCLGVQVNKTTSMSTKLCVKCYRKIIEFYNFKLMAIKNDAHWQSLDQPELKNVTFLSDGDNNIKEEKVSGDSDYENPEEPLIDVKEDDTNFNDLATQNNIFMFELKDECKQEDQSDDEFLSIIKSVKDQATEETKENVYKKIVLTSNNPAPKFKHKKPKKKYKEKSKVCEECGKEVKNLKEHMLQHVPLEERTKIKCELCDKLLASAASKKKHIQRKHLNMNKKECHICKKSVSLLKQHILIVHNKESLPFQCVSCDSRFLTKARLTMHLSVHTKDRPFDCEICGNKYRNKLGLRNHIRQVHDKERSHLCQFCSKSFFKKNHLQIHLRSHTKEKPYRCPECSKHFQSSTTLKNHRFIHTKEKQFNCTMCDMSFYTNNNLRSHVISHIKDKKYPCKFCDVKFHRSDHRKRHEFTAHLRNAIGTT